MFAAKAALTIRGFDKISKVRRTFALLLLTHRTFAIIRGP
jgi:hypothetical protein